MQLEFILKVRIPGVVCVERGAFDLALSMAQCLPANTWGLATVSAAPGGGREAGARTQRLCGRSQSRGEHAPPRSRRARGTFCHKNNCAHYLSIVLWDGSDVANIVLLVSHNNSIK